MDESYRSQKNNLYTVSEKKEPDLQLSKKVSDCSDSLLYTGRNFVLWYFRMAISQKLWGVARNFLYQ